MEPIRLRRYQIDREFYVPFAFKFGLWPKVRQMGIAFILLSLFVGLALGPIWGAAALALFAWIVVCIVGVRYRNVRAAFANPQNRSAFEERSVEFDDQELRVTTIRNNRTQIPFANLVRIQEVEDRFLVSLSAAQFYMIPKSAFSAPSDIESFRSIARRHGVLQ